ncbi:MAG: hypothetical protein KAT70_03265 [Thermoplasmata archaeon]|nr:hypothetical protein [Thermoplasmata archaeon]
MITTNLVPIQGDIQIADLRTLAQNEPAEFVQKLQIAADAGEFRLDKLTDIRSLYLGLANVDVPVKAVFNEVQRAITTSAFPVMTGIAVIAQVNAAYDDVPSIGQDLVTDFDDNKKVTIMAQLHTLDKDQDEVKELGDFPEIGASEETTEVRHRKNGRRITFSAESILENDLQDIVSRTNALGTISGEIIEELTLQRVTDHSGSGTSPAEPFVYRPNGTGTQLYNETVNTPGTRAPSGTRIQTNPLTDTDNLEAARVVLAAMQNERGKRRAVAREKIGILLPDAVLGAFLAINNSEFSPGVENEKSNWGPKGRWNISADNIHSSPKVDDLSTSAWYYGAFKEQFRRKWKMRMEMVSLGQDTQAYLMNQTAFQARLAWDVEVGAIDYGFVIQNLSSTTAPIDE